VKIAPFQNSAARADELVVEGEARAIAPIASRISGMRMVHGLSCGRAWCVPWP
jgi:hypothetical protein